MGFRWLSNRFHSTLVISKHEVTQKKFRETMGRISSQAMILTTAIPIHCSHETFRGVTLSSVTSLALKPAPLIQFNLQLPSFTSDYLHDFNYFALHLMKPNAESIRLARNFSKGAIRHIENGNVVPTQPFRELAEGIHYETYDIEDTNLCVPILKNSERVIVCKGYRNFKVGDHEIWVGNVQDIVNHDLQEEEEITGGLLYCNRNFHRMGKLFEE